MTDTTTSNVPDTLPNENDGAVYVNASAAGVPEKQDQREAIPLPFLDVDTSYSITYINSAGAALVGKSPSELLGFKCYDIFKTPHCRTDRCALRQAMQTGQSVTSDTLARPTEGTIIPIRYTGTPIWDENGTIVGASEFVQDISEEVRQRTSASQKIKNLDSMPTPVLSVDTDFTINYINPAGAAVVGLTPDTTIGKKCYDLFKTPHCRTDKCALGIAMREDRTVTKENLLH